MKTNSYASLCDDFYLDMCVNTELELPRQRDTVLAFFERIQKQYTSMCCFYRRENEYCLEENRETGNYRWVCFEKNRVGSGIVNPSALEDACEQHKFILELAPYMLSVSHLDIDSLDVTFAMDFDYAGSHDEIIAEALGSAAFNCLLEVPGAKAVDFSPSMVVALSADSCTQARVSIESKTSIYESSRQNYKSEESISLSLTVRQYPPPKGGFDALESFDNQVRLGQELMNDKIVPNFVMPLIDVITQKRLI